MSSSEAEYVAASTSACEAVWLRRLLGDLCQDKATATEVFCDNRATIAMTKNPTFHSRTKHIDIQHHYIRDLFARKEIVLKQCSTNEQVADVLTKSLSKVKHGFFRLQMGVTTFEARGSVE